MIFNDQNLSLEKCPALVLNADYRPLSYYPLSLWSWQDSIKSVFLDRVVIVSNYDRVIRSPSFNMRLPSVIALKSFIKPQSNPSFTRFNVFLRVKFMLFVNPRYHVALCLAQSLKANIANWTL